MAKAKKQKNVKQSAPKAKKGMSAGIKALVACIAIVVIGGGVVGGLWLGGVFDPKVEHPMDFLSTITEMKAEQQRELVGAYQGEDGNLHLLYSNGTLKSMYIQLLTTPILKNSMNANGEIVFTKEEVSSETIGKAVSKSVTASMEHTVGAKLGLEYQVGKEGIASKKISMEFSYEFKTSSSSTYEESSYRDIGTSLSISESHTFYLSDCESGYYYAFALYADFDVFTDVAVKINGEDDLQVVSAEPYYAMSSKRPSIRVVASKTNSFNVPDDLETEKLSLTGYIDKYEIFGEGSGTSGDPYKIYAPSQLMYIGLKPSAHYQLVKDIKLTGWQWLNAISFNGSLDGNNKTISNLLLEYDGGAVATERQYGLFSAMSGNAVVKNLTLDNCKINVKQTSDSDSGTGYIYAGILVGAAGGIIENVTVRYSTVEVNRYNSTIGGISGRFAGTMTNCKSLGVTVKGSGNMGLITGRLWDGVMKDCVVDSCKVDGLGDALATIDYNCKVENRGVGGMAGFVTTADVNLLKPNISGGKVKNLCFIFSGNANNHPIVGYVAGIFQGYMYKIDIPTGFTLKKSETETVQISNTVYSMAREAFPVFEDSDKQGGGQMDYFFGSGPYNSSDGWWWWNNENINHKPIEIGKRIDDWYLVKY